MENDEKRCLFVIIRAAHVSLHRQPQGTDIPCQNLILKRLRNIRPVNVKRRELEVIIQLLRLVLANDI